MADREKRAAEVESHARLVYQLQEGGSSCTYITTGPEPQPPPFRYSPDWLVYGGVFHWPGQGPAYVAPKKPKSFSEWQKYAGDLIAENQARHR